MSQCVILSARVDHLVCVAGQPEFEMGPSVLLRLLNRVRTARMDHLVCVFSSAWPGSARLRVLACAGRNRAFASMLLYAGGFGVLGLALSSQSLRRFYDPSSRLREPCERTWLQELVRGSSPN